MDTVYDFAFSEQGHNHIKADKVCQDFSGHYSDDDMTVVVVADGHGSDNYPRTDRGSRFAVKAAIEAIKEFVGIAKEDTANLFADSESYLEQLSKSILAKWYAAIDVDIETHPFSEEELLKVSDKYKSRYLAGERQEKAYGTTLIAACQTKDYWFGLQIGDGRCVCITSDGTMVEPIPWDENCQANITTSICDADAINEFRYCLLRTAPIATFMGTDGIEDSYADSEELYVLYRSILAIFAEQGPKIGGEEVRTFLPGLSRKGSGDDVSIAGICSTTLAPTFIDVLKAKCEYANAKALKDRAVHETVLAREKLVYINEALQKARSNLDICEQKAEEARSSVEKTHQAEENAIKRFQAAEAALEDALRIHQEKTDAAILSEVSYHECITASDVADTSKEAISHDDPDAPAPGLPAVERPADSKISTDGESPKG